MYFSKMNEAAAKLVAAANRRLKTNKKNALKSKKHSESIKNVNDLDEREIARIDIMSYDIVIANFKNGKKREYVRTGRDSWKVNDLPDKRLTSFDLMNNLPYIEGCKLEFI